MQEVKIFENADFGAVRVTEINGKPYFMANDIARCLGYSIPKDAIARHCKGALKHRYPTDGGIQEVNFIPEGDVYRLIIRSKLPAAEKFENWVFDEVLPSIRQTGGYGNIDIQAVIAESVKQSVSAVIKEVLPMLLKAEMSKDSRRDYRGTIEKADVVVRNEADEMIFSGRFTYSEVARFLRENGVKTTYTSVYRYAKKMGLR